MDGNDASAEQAAQTNTPSLQPHVPGAPDVIHSYCGETDAIARFTPP